MDKQKSYKVIAVIALITAIVGLSVGFAAFSTALNITPSTSSVKPDDSTFSVSFSSANNILEEDDIVGVVSDNENVVATDAKINNNNYKNPIISGLSAKFTEPGQSVTYTFYAMNTGSYDSYLKSITFNNISGKSNSKICSPVEITNDEGENTFSATDSLVQTACEDIYMKIEIVGSDTITTTEDKNNITNHMLERDATEKITVTLTYDGDASSTRADGEFTVDFGSITLNYSSVD